MQGTDRVGEDECGKDVERCLLDTALTPKELSPSDFLKPRWVLSIFFMQELLNTGRLKNAK
jgi:hypothetical protein